MILNFRREWSTALAIEEAAKFAWRVAVSYYVGFPGPGGGAVWSAGVIVGCRLLASLSSLLKSRELDTRWAVASPKARAIETYMLDIMNWSHGEVSAM